MAAKVYCLVPQKLAKWLVAGGRRSPHPQDVRLQAVLPLPRIHPMRLRLVESFDDPDYLFELKHDGFRAIAYIENGKARLVSRNLKNLRFESLVHALSLLPVKNAIIDGESVCLDAQGVSRFKQLLSRKAEPVLYAFDLLWLDGNDLRGWPLISRKERLDDLLHSSPCERIIYAQHIEQHGKRFFEEICARDLEGVVAKRKQGVYKHDGIGWLKIRNPTYSQAEGRHELLTRRK